MPEQTATIPYKPTQPLPKTLFDPMFGLGTSTDVIAPAPVAPKKVNLGPQPKEDLDAQLVQAAEQSGELKLAQEKEKAFGESELAKAESALAAEEARKTREDPFRLEMQKKIKERADTTFVPTKENVADLGAVFTLTNLLGFLIGGKSKGNAQASMSAMNGILEGHQKGREDQVKKQKETYEQNMKALDRTIDNLSREYQDAMSLYAKDRSAGLAAARDTVARHNAQFIKDAQEKYGLAYAYEKIQQAVKLRDQRQEKEERLRIQEEERKFRHAMLINKAAASEPSPNHATELEDAAQAIANYAEAPPGLRDKDRYKILARVRQINPQYNEGDYGNRTKSLNHWNDPQFAGGKQIGSYVTVASHLEAIDKLAEALNNKNSVATNATINYIKTQLGHPQVTNFNTAKEAVSAEIVRAIEGGPGGVADREAARDLLSAANSPQQLKEAIGILRELIKRRIETTQLQYEQSTGRQDFQQRFPANVQRYLDIHGTSAEAFGGTGTTPSVTPEKVIELRGHADEALKSIDKLNVPAEEKERRKAALRNAFKQQTGQEF